MPTEEMNFLRVRRTESRSESGQTNAMSLHPKGINPQGENRSQLVRVNGSMGWQAASLPRRRVAAPLVGPFHGPRCAISRQNQVCSIGADNAQAAHDSTYMPQRSGAA